MIIYFSKVNLNSEHIFDAYKDEKIFLDVRNKILLHLVSGLSIVDINRYFDVNGIVCESEVVYKIVIHKKNDEYIHGVLYKDSTIYHKMINEQTGEIQSHPVPNIEDIEFYYDVGKELIGFHTRSRFGFKDFNEVMSRFLNKSMTDNSIDYRFEVSLHNEGSDIASIRKSIKAIGLLKQLIFKFQPPNPNENFLEELKNGTTDTVKELEDANATGMSVIFDSKGILGLNLESFAVQSNLDRLSNMQKGITLDTATKNGYASLKAISKNGKIFTTENEKPTKREIQRPEEFLIACKDTILSLLKRGDENA